MLLHDLPIFLRDWAVLYVMITINQPGYSVRTDEQRTAPSDIAEAKLSILGVFSTVPSLLFRPPLFRHLDTGSPAFLCLNTMAIYSLLRTFSLHFSQYQEVPLSAADRLEHNGKMVKNYQCSILFSRCKDTVLTPLPKNRQAFCIFHTALGIPSCSPGQVGKPLLRGRPY